MSENYVILRTRIRLDSKRAAVDKLTDHCDKNVTIDVSVAPTCSRNVTLARRCEANPGTFCFHRPTYEDQSARPTFLEFGLLDQGERLWVERFLNR